MSGDNYDDDCFIDWTGKIFNNQYIALKQIGKGSLSSVWLCYEYSSNNYYALKIFNRDDYEVGVTEIKLNDSIKKLKCPNIMNYKFKFEQQHNEIKDTNKNDEDESEDDSSRGEYVHLFMGMDLMASSTYDLLKIDRYKNGLPAKIVKNIIKQTLEALVSLHSNNYFHSDIKPENIFLAGDRKDYDQIKRIISDLKQNMHNNKNKTIKNNRNNKRKNTQEIFAGKMQLLGTSYREKVEKDILEFDIDDKYISDPIIKLGDLGMCKKIDDDQSFQIQTRYYKAPEVILNIEVNEKCDMWSLGCLIYELLTGKILYNPDSSNNVDKYHIYMIVQTLGMPEKEYINKSPNKEVIFCKDLKRIRGYYDIKYKSIIGTLSEKITHENEVDVVLIIDLVMKMLTWDTTKRISAKDALMHPLFAK